MVNTGLAKITPMPFILVFYNHSNSEKCLCHALVSQAKLPPMAICVSQFKFIYGYKPQPWHIIRKIYPKFVIWLCSKLTNTALPDSRMVCLWSHIPYQLTQIWDRYKQKKRFNYMKNVHTNQFNPSYMIHFSTTPTI